MTPPDAMGDASPVELDDAPAGPVAGEGGHRPPLRLLAQDAEDLTILSAALQDGAVRLADISYAPAARTLTFPITRFRHECDPRNKVDAALQFGDVLSVKARGLDTRELDRTCNLLACEFEPDAEPPGGVVMLHFAGSGELRVEVECVDAALVDIGPLTPCDGAPRHEP